MAHIEIIPDGTEVIWVQGEWQAPKMTMVDENVDPDHGHEEPWWVATCTCGVSGTDRGHFEDTVQYALTHVEGAHE